MPALPTAALARELRPLDDVELAAFVADLWAARGFDTSVQDATVLAERGVESLSIRCGGPVVDEGPDVIVKRSPGSVEPDDADVRVVGPEELREMLLYATDRANADRLCRAHIGRPLSGQPDDTPLGDRLPARSTGRLLAIAVVAVLVVGLAVGTAGSGLPFVHGEPPVAAGPTAELTPAGDAASTATAAGTDSGLPAVGFAPASYPPGLGPTGVTDARALAAAHRQGLANASWTLSIAHDRSHDLLHPFRDWTGSRQVIERTGPTRYRYQVAALAEFENDTFVAETYVDYGDGTANYRQRIGQYGALFRRTQLPTDGAPGVFAAVSAAYVQRYLTATRSRVETIRSGATTRQRVVVTGTPTAMARTVENYTAVAVVGPRGLVHTLTVEYTLLARVPEPTPNGVATPYQSADRVATEPVARVRFQMVLTGLGRTRVPAPDWYERARNATDGPTLPPWPTDPAV